LYDTRTIGLEGAVTFILSEPQHEKDYREGFQYLSEGDSAEFITDARALYMKRNKVPVPNGMKMESVISVYARVLKIRTPEEHAKDIQEEKDRLEKAEFEEKKIMDKYMADSSITAEMIDNGMYYVKLRGGKGITPDSGSVALLNYRGTFLNGRCFDFFYESQPFEWMVGQEEQLIKGLEVGVKRMHEGEKAKFIIPSHLAYGSTGSANGIVRPFTTVIYEVELLKVQ
jgi:FKBP-type peptidyl-prolyl cis-trans isomerase